MAVSSRSIRDQHRPSNDRKVKPDSALLCRDHGHRAGLIDLATMGSFRVQCHDATKQAWYAPVPIDDAKSPRIPAPRRHEKGAAAVDRLSPLGDRGRCGVSRFGRHDGAPVGRVPAARGRAVVLRIEPQCVSPLTGFHPSRNTARPAAPAFITKAARPVAGDRGSLMAVAPTRPPSGHSPA